MHDLITRMDGWLQQHRPTYYATLANGVSVAAFDDYERRTGITLPADLRALWSWKDGSTEEALFTNHMFISVEDSLSSKMELDGMIGSDFEDQNGGNSSGYHLRRALAAIISVSI
jgi:cell wall assembly regulator SMI1